MAEVLTADSAVASAETPETDRFDVIEARIREQAATLLENETVAVVIGYARGWDEHVATPCFLTDASRASELIYDEHCTHNLAKYLVGPDGYLTSPFKTANGKPQVGLVATPATLRAIVGLIQEHQFDREDVVVLAITDGTPVGIEPDSVVGVIAQDAERQARIAAAIQELETMSVRERWEWWEKQFSSCIRCYACRQACPFCYCEQCIADENQPQWINRSPTTLNNRAWNAIRAFHLVSRCIDCGECERVCPVDIPLSVLNSRMATEVVEAFGYVAGQTSESPSALFSFRTEDPDDFVR